MSETANSNAVIPKAVAAIAETLGCKLFFKGQSISCERAFALNGLLPGLVRRADQLAGFCIGYQLGATFEQADHALSGVVVQFDDRISNALRLLCITDVLIEIVQHAPDSQQVSLDMLGS